ncbi:MAG: MBL fold metallo-hydrolase [Bacteroidales bacterium]|nr:MBL fold metallo-hydrolase [Bacteroidales bacterium]
MKLTFLGTGTSTGIPVLGCRCRVCLSTDRRDMRLRCSSLITTDDGRHILIDCGPDIRTQLLANDVRSIDSVLITHSHYDHVGGLDDLRTLSYENPVEIFCTADVAADIRRLMPYCFSGKNYPNIPRLTLTVIKPYVPFQTCGVRFEPLRVRHGQLPIVGYLFGSTAYLTDATEIPAESLDLLSGLDVLIINALRITPNPTHMNLAEALSVIKAVSPRQAYLIHMSHQMGGHAEASLRLPPGVEFAYDNLTITLGEWPDQSCRC